MADTIDTGKPTQHRVLRQLTVAVASTLERGLQELGLRPGDRVGVLEDNCLSAADAYLGLTAANLVRVPLYPRNSREAHAHMLGHTGCRAVTTTVPYADSVSGLENDLPALEHVLVRDEGYEDWLAAQSATDPDVAVRESDWYIIRHTAGPSRLATTRAPRSSALPSAAASRSATSGVRSTLTMPETPCLPKRRVVPRDSQMRLSCSCEPVSTSLNG